MTTWDDSLQGVGRWETPEVIPTSALPVVPLGATALWKPHLH